MRSVLPKYKKLIGKDVVVWIKNGKKIDYYRGKLYFVGVNYVGHKVVSFEPPSRAIMYLDSWDDLHIEPYKENVNYSMKKLKLNGG